MNTPEPRQRQRASVAAPAIGIAGAVVLLLAGGWLMFTPFAFGYQPSGADWTDATTTDFSTGAGIAAAALLAAVALTAQLAGRLHALHGTASATDKPQGDAETPDEAPAEDTCQPKPAAVPSETSEVATILTPLVDALIHDLSAHREETPPAQTGSYQQAAGGGR